MSMFSAHVPGPVVPGAEFAAAQVERPVWKVTLLDGATGRRLRLAGEELAVYTRDPAPAGAALMQGRDPLRWMPLAERVGARQ